MVTWQEAPPPSFEDWAEMKEIYLSLLRPRKATLRPRPEGSEAGNGWPERENGFGGARVAAARVVSLGSETQERRVM
jgi:hypothetical protein